MGSPFGLPALHVEAERAFEPRRRHLSWSNLTSTVGVSPRKLRGRPQHAADRLADTILLAWPQVSVDVERHPGGLVAESDLHLLHAAPGVNERAGEEVAKIVEAHRRRQTSSLAGHSDVVAEPRGVHRLLRLVDDDAARAGTESRQMGGQALEDPVVGRDQSGARLRLGWREGAGTGGARLLPLAIDRDNATEEVDAINGEPGCLRLTETKSSSDDDRNGKPFIRLVTSLRTAS